MRVYLGTLLNFPHDRQFLITLHDDNTVTSSTRPTSDPSVPWTRPERLGQVQGGVPWI